MNEIEKKMDLSALWTVRRERFPQVRQADVEDLEQEGGGDVLTGARRAKMQRARSRGMNEENEIEAKSGRAAVFF